MHIQLAAFNQTYSETWEQKVKQKDFKNLNFAFQRIMCKVGVRSGMCAEEIIIIKKKPNSLDNDNKKDDLRACKKSARLHPLQA